MKILTLILLCTFSGIANFSDNPNDYPTPPQNKELMFYIQRNHNRNTIVYEANFDENGLLNPDEPLLVSWIRYEEQGQRMELRTIEKWYAYGLKTKKKSGEKGVYIVTLVAYKDRKLYLIQNRPFQAQISMVIDDKESLLDHIYIQADNSGIWPTVEYIELFGTNLSSTLNRYEKIYNN